MCVQALSSLQAYIITVLVGLIARYLWCSIFSVCISGLPSTISNPHTLNLIALLTNEIWPIKFLSLVDARQLRIIAEFYSALKYG